MKCTAGTVYSITTKTCDDCPIGFYRGQTDTKCEACPPGKTTETVGSTSSSECIGKTVLPHKTYSNVTAVSHQCCKSVSSQPQLQMLQEDISNYSVAVFQFRNIVHQLVCVCSRACALVRVRSCVTVCVR